MTDKMLLATELNHQRVSHDDVTGGRIHSDISSSSNSGG